LSNTKKLLNSRLKILIGIKMLFMPAWKTSSAPEISRVSYHPFSPEIKHFLRRSAKEKLRDILKNGRPFTEPQPADGLCGPG